MCAHEVDLATVRLMASRWLMAAKSPDERFGEGLRDSDEIHYPGALAQNVAGIDKIYANELHPSAHAQMVNRSGSIFDAGFEFGLAVAVAIVQEPLSDPRPRWMSSLEDAKKSIAETVAGAIEDGEITSRPPRAPRA